MKLRDYQQRAHVATQRALIEKKNVLIVAPCAAGKTVLFCSVTKWLLGMEKSRRVVVLLDRDGLIRQTAKRLAEFTGRDVGVACDGEKDIWKDIVVASRQTLAPILKKESDYKVNLLILDEAHLVNQRGGQYMDIIGRLRDRYPVMRILGYTATPYRMDGLIYGEDKLFESINHRITAKELLAGDFIVPLRWKVRQSDLWQKLDRCKKSAGDLNSKVQEKILSAGIFIESVFQAWREHCEGKKTVIFAINIAHAETIYSFFVNNGVNSWRIHSELNKNEVSESISAFSSGKGVMINVDILTIGSDIPSIEAIILARRTLSTSLFFQIIGRGGRICTEIGKKECLVIDMCGSCLIHGTDQDNPNVRIVKGNNEPALKLCPECERLLGIRTKKCPYCHFIFPEPETPEKKKQLASAEKKACGEIIDFDPGKLIHTVRCDMIRSAVYRKNKEKETVKIAFISSEGKQICTKWVSPHPVRSRDIRKRYPKMKADELWRDMTGDKEAAPPQSPKEWVSRQKEITIGLWVVDIDFSGQYPAFKKIRREK